MANESERFNEAKATAVYELLNFAAHHDANQVALCAASLANRVHAPDEAHIACSLDSIRAVAGAIADRFNHSPVASAGPSNPADVRASLVASINKSIDALEAMRAFLAFDVPQPAPVERAPAQLAPALEGLAWVEAAESLARFSGCAELAVSLLYLRGALAGDGGRPALNLAEALSIMTKDQATTLDAVLEAEGAPEAVRDHTGGEECERRAALLASGWLWLRKLAAK